MSGPWLTPHHTIAQINPCENETTPETLGLKKRDISKKPNRNQTQAAEAWKTARREGIMCICFTLLLGIEGNRYFWVFFWSIFFFFADQDQRTEVVTLMFSGSQMSPGAVDPVIMILCGPASTTHTHTHTLVLHEHTKNIIWIQTIVTTCDTERRRL